MRIHASVMILLSFLCISHDSMATSVAFEKWRHDKPCGKKLASPVRVATGDCESALCVNTPGQSQLCACLSADGEGVTKMTYREHGEVRLQWDTSLYPSGDPSAFRVDTADLDGDGKEELVIGTRNSVSDGMAVEQWNIRVLSDDHISDPVDVADYGTMSFLSTNGKQCRLLGARWVEGWEPVKGYGLYLVGRWMELSDGDLINTFERPMIKRRFLKSLEQLRIHGGQVFWFKGREASPIEGPYPF